MVGRLRWIGLVGAGQSLVAAGALVFLSSGCSTISGAMPGSTPLGNGWLLTGKIDSKINEASLRKLAEADSFPTPAEAGM